ncbi:hypothetical protein JHN49_06185 [Streptomyces sp. MBT57]|nr:hypothetical protein [Streptomyces sp. MBT57]
MAIIVYLNPDELMDVMEDLSENGAVEWTASDGTPVHVMLSTGEEGSV